MWTRWQDFDRSFSAMDEFRRRMDRLFDEFERTAGTAGVAQFPRTSLYDTDDAFLVRAEVPGLGEKDIQLSVQQDVLTLSGERKAEIPTGYSVHRQERLPLRFSRSITLPSKVDASQVTASVKDGILTVKVPKAAESKPRQITISGS